MASKQSTFTVITPENTDLFKAANQRSGLSEGGGGGTLDGMEARVAVLEQIAMDNRDTFKEIKGDLRAISIAQTDLKASFVSQTSDVREKIAGLPTRGSLWGMVATVIATSLAIIGLFVGILTYLHEIAI